MFVLWINVKISLLNSENRGDSQRGQQIFTSQRPVKKHTPNRETQIRMTSGIADIDRADGTFSLYVSLNPQIKICGYNILPCLTALGFGHALDHAVRKDREGTFKRRPSG
jgi:hypothetical protein